MSETSHSWRPLAICSGGFALAIAGMLAWDRGPTPQQIDAGRVLFTKEWTVGDPDCRGDGLGPVFNANSCAACHFQGGVGGSGPRSAAVSTFEIVDFQNPDQLITGVIHKEAAAGFKKESGGRVSELFSGPSQTETRVIQSNCGGQFSFTVTKSDPVFFHTVDSPPLFGLGEIESISDWALFAKNAARLRDEVAADFKGQFKRIGRGRPRMHDGRIGKFGWKGQFASVDDFVAAACAMELGLSNPRVRQPLAGEHRGDDDAEIDMTGHQLDELIAFVKSLPRPRQIIPDDAVSAGQVARGELVFNQSQCNVCHIKTIGDVEGIYTDFRLYQLQEKAVVASGGGYGGSGDQFETLHQWPEHLPSVDDWQTPPLWGVADSAPYMHDGSADTLLWAIEKHGGDAELSRAAFRGHGQSDREALIAFLQSLRAPQIP